LILVIELSIFLPFSVPSSSEGRFSGERSGKSFNFFSNAGRAPIFDERRRILTCGYGGE
jgi:hypothetical protein